MSKLKELGFDIEAPITWLNAEKTSAQATYGVHPYGIDKTATPAQWAALEADLASGVVAVQDMAPAPKLSIDALAAETRAQRDALLAASDWTQFPDVMLAAEKRAAWNAYRTALRAVPEQPGFPTDVAWPEKP